jgi:hypothetical protein
MKHAYRWTAPLALSLLTACGGHSHNNSTGPSSVTIGGSVAGLTAAGLVLANGSDTVTVDANATSYQVSTAVGSTYAISVQTQPTGETCTIANASGTANANVTDADVSCTPNSYTLGGSISGLTAAGLVLANGSDTVTVPANASSYQFSNAIASGTAYDVKVTTQPSGEACTVATTGQGTANANVTDADVSCTPTYSIGGSVSGLTAPGTLVLQNNGGDDVNISQGANSFTFNAQLIGGALYDVTVESSPNGLACTVSDGSGTVASANVTNITVSCNPTGPDVATITVEPGPADEGYQTFNMPYVSVKVCDTGTPQKCAVIDNVQVDTGSAGLRLLSSALTNAGLSLIPIKDGSNNPIEECHPFGGAYVSWGAVGTATITVGGETTKAPIPVQVIDDSSSNPSTDWPPDCTNRGAPQSTVNDFDANGVLGIGLFPQDCGQRCVDIATVADSWYYSCPSPTTCTQTTVALEDQVVNPVTTFPTDNNGVAVQLPELPTGGALTATGYLIFGIGTQNNNGLSSSASANILTPADSSGFISTQITGPTAQPAVNGFFDSGSNSLIFADTDLTPCTGVTAGFYCPDHSPQPITVTNGGGAAISIDIANLAELLSNPATQNNFAFADVGAQTSGEFDWGLPFFYGRTVYTAIQGTTVMVGGTPTAYANGFYAY